MNAVNIQICRTLLWALPTNKMLPKSTPPLQSDFNDCVYSSCHGGPEATFSTKFKHPVNPGAQLRPASCRASPRLAKQWQATHMCPWWVASPPTRGGALRAAWAQTRGTGPGCGQERADSSQCRFPCLSKAHLQAAFQRDEFRVKFIKSSF